MHLRSTGLRALFTLLLGLAACKGEPGTNDDAGTDAETGGTDSGTGGTDSETGGTNSETGGTDSETGGTDSGTETGGWGDVPCGDDICVDGDICVQPGVDCDYTPCEQDMEAEWIHYEPFCAPFPEECPLEDPRYCLELAYCVLPRFGEFVDGLLECDNVALDCYC
ncbi:MAG: hypothetical protein KC457_16565 [Myxococcales bacterium]|nr:hypothetical protein [Myxococcales bacterium]